MRVLSPASSVRLGAGRASKPRQEDGNIVEPLSWSGGTGRRTRLKISRCVNSVGVQLPPPATPSLLSLLCLRERWARWREGGLTEFPLSSSSLGTFGS